MVWWDPRREGVGVSVGQGEGYNRRRATQYNFNGEVSLVVVA